MAIILFWGIVVYYICVGEGAECDVVRVHAVLEDESLSAAADAQSLVRCLLQTRDTLWSSASKENSSFFTSLLIPL